MILNLIKNFFVIKKYKSLNKKIFKRKNAKYDSEILIEFNTFASYHVLVSYFANYLSKRFSSKIVGYYNYSLIASNLKNSIFNKIKWFIISNLFLKYCGIYNSFGVTKFIRPNSDSDLEQQAQKELEAIQLKILSQDDIKNINVQGIVIGDLIIDSYLRFNKLRTFDHKDVSFIKYIQQFLVLFFYFKKIFSQNNIKAVIGVHATYSYGLILRMSMSANIPSFTIYEGKLFRLTLERPFQISQFLDYNFFFNKLSNEQKSQGINIGRNLLEKRISGGKTHEIYQNFATKSSFEKMSGENNRVLKNDRKIKILIATHEYFDSPHVYGDFFFNDFYDWTTSLAKFSRETEYQWYIKDHPRYKGKIKDSQKFTYETTRDIVNEHKNITYIDPDTSHHQIIKEGINFVCTVYGSVLFEYPAFGIPVLPATKNHPCNQYNFFINSSSKENYFENLRNLSNTKIKINLDELYEFYYMHFHYSNHDSFYDLYGDFMKKFNKYEKYFTSDFYEYWYQNWDINQHQEILKNLHRFYNSNDYMLNNFYTSKI
jgi:hypothetical protein